jgi:hypothetical protein
MKMIARTKLPPEDSLQSHSHKFLNRIYVCANFIPAVVISHFAIYIYKIQIQFLARF